MADSPEDETLPAAPEALSRALGERYLTYALSTIMHRALPDARDGLKPVQRRILYAMSELGLAPGGRFLKCAKITGQTTGDFHPHGEDAVYEALVRMAQDFVMRAPLVAGQGNFGNIDGDEAAARRYTEAKLTEASMALLDGLDEDAVDFRPNYDERLDEPAVLPASIPNLLANGAAGIAVGMATSIPPHNLGELCAALLHLIKHPGAPLETLLAHLPGPDFPTGGVLVEPPASIREAYATGRGGFRLRAAWHREELGRGQWQVVVTEIPYQVPKSRLIERIADLITSKKAPVLADIRDESTDEVRIVLEPRTRSIEPAVMMETLFRLSDLETRFPLNLNVLIDGRTPKVCSLPEVMRAFLDHRREVLQRRARHRLAKIAHRLEVLEGYIVAFLNLDRVIEIIRAEDEPKPALMAEDWGGGVTLTEVQAEAILNMRLRSLRRLEEMQLRQERDELIAERDGLDALLGDEDAQWAKLAAQLREIRDKFGPPKPLRGLRSAEDIAAGRARHLPYPPGARRTALEAAPAIEEVPPEALIEREPITVVCSREGWIRALKGHQALDGELKYRDGDAAAFVFHAQTTDKILALSAGGRIFTLAAERLPGGRGLGEPIRLMIELPNDDRLVALFVHEPGRRRLVVSSVGEGFLTPEDGLLTQTRTGRALLSLRDAEVRVCRPVGAGDDHVAAIGDNRKMLVCPLSDLPEMARGKGVRLQKYKDGGLSDARTLRLGDGLSWPDSAGRTRSEPDLSDWLGKRGGPGRMAPRGFPRDNRFPD
ncbi:MAG: DNA topoisomerase IV subunit A [Pikeienuella sp.]